MRHYSRLISQHRLLLLAATGLALQVSLVLILLPRPEGQVCIFKRVILPNWVLLVRHDHRSIILINMRIYQLWQGALTNQICMLIRNANIIPVLFVRLSTLLLASLLIVIGIIIAFTCSSCIFIIWPCTSHLRILALLLVEDSVVDGLLGGIWTCSRIFEKSLTICLLKAWVIHQNLLLLGQIARLSLKIATNESSTAPGNFHEILS